MSDEPKIRLYRPSNGTEGIYFTEKFCEHCIHDHPDPEKEPKCEILTCSMCFGVNDPEYPKEWRYDENGNPTCTNFVKWDWGKDDDGNWIEPTPPEPINPNQMVLPFILNEIENSPTHHTEPQLTHQ